MKQSNDKYFYKIINILYYYKTIIVNYFKYYFVGLAIL